MIPPNSEPLASRIPPGDLVVSAVRLSGIAEEIEELSVIAERLRGTPWEAVGKAYGGLSRAAAHGRFGKAVKRYQVLNPGTAAEQFVLAEAQLKDLYQQLDDLLASQRELTRLSELSGLVAEELPAQGEPVKEESLGQKIIRTDAEGARKLRNALVHGRQIDDLVLPDGTVVQAKSWSMQARAEFIRSWAEREAAQAFRSGGEPGGRVWPSLTAVLQQHPRFTYDLKDAIHSNPGIAVPGEVRTSLQREPEGELEARVAALETAVLRLMAAEGAKPM
ncbi:hypothetical protein [Streptomyces sp. NPDC090131]|uniref:hypothetical protein n=1 Tax=Streptomyces sp. NPDC090131 TaxID=3365954 RepID=UPI0037FC0D1F